MVYVPRVKRYKPFYIQADSDSVAFDTAEFGLIAKSNPYPILPTPKEPYKNDYKDEDGDDEYTSVMRYGALTFSVSFYVKAYSDDSNTAEAVLRSQIRAFFNKIKEGDFCTYDSYTGLGFRKVRYSGFNEESFKSNGQWARAIFSVSFKANDPVTEMFLSNDGSIIEKENNG